MIKLILAGLLLVYTFSGQPHFFPEIERQVVHVTRSAKNGVHFEANWLQLLAVGVNPNFMAIAKNVDPLDEPKKMDPYADAFLPCSGEQFSKINVSLDRVNPKDVIRGDGCSTWTDPNTLLFLAKIGAEPVMCFFRIDHIFGRRGEPNRSSKFDTDIGCSGRAIVDDFRKKRQTDLAYVNSGGRYPELGTSLSFGNFVAGFSLPEGNPNKANPDETENERTNGSPEHSLGPVSRVFLRLQIPDFALVPIFLIGIGLGILGFKCFAYAADTGRNIFFFVGTLVALCGGGIASGVITYWVSP